MLFALLLPAAWAQAAPMVFVASTGVGASCTRAAPCATFTAALSAVDLGGTVTCLDSGPITDTGVTTIISVTIDCAAVYRPTAANSGGFALSGTPGVVVRIRNLTFNGGAGGWPAIRITGSPTVILENCVFESFQTGNAAAIEFLPDAFLAQLIIKDTIISHNGSGTSGGGIVVQASGSGNGNATLERVHVDKNVTGIFLNAGVGQTVRVAIKDSTVAGNTFTGVYALSTGGVLTGVIAGSAIANNGGIGLLSQGANAFVFVSGSTITGNDTGWTVTSGGNLASYGTNSVNLNRTSDGAPSASIGLQ
jgi:hypothetical protein